MKYLLATIYAVLFCWTASAQTETYSYTGVPWSNTDASALYGAQDIENPLTIVFTTSAPLGANFDGTVAPTSFEFCAWGWCDLYDYDGLGTYGLGSEYNAANLSGNGVAYLASDSFTVETDSSGDIIAWSIYAADNVVMSSAEGMPGGPFTNNLDQVAANDCSGTATQSCVEIGASAAPNLAGWSYSPALIETAPTPEPRWLAASLGLCVLLGLMAWRQRKHAPQQEDGEEEPEPIAARVQVPDYYVSCGHDVQALREGLCSDCILESITGTEIKSLKSIMTEGPLNRWRRQVVEPDADFLQAVLATGYLHINGWRRTVDGWHNSQGQLATAWNKREAISIQRVRDRERAALPPGLGEAIAAADGYWRRSA
jgi:hypothetical protein